MKPQARRKASPRVWKLEEAKARFSELVRRAREEGPQRVTVRGRDAVVVVSAEEHDRMQPQPAKQSFIEFMQSLSLGELELEREPDLGRNVDL